MTSLDEIVRVAEIASHSMIDTERRFARAVLSMAPIVRQASYEKCRCVSGQGGEVHVCVRCRCRSLVSNVGKEGAP